MAIVQYGDDRKRSVAKQASGAGVDGAAHRIAIQLRRY